MKVYRYYTPYRPPAPGAVPSGFIDAQVWGSRPFVPEINHTVWGTVDYAQPLTQKQMADYELLPANMQQQPVEVPEVRR